MLSGINDSMFNLIPFGVAPYSQLFAECIYRYMEGKKMNPAGVGCWVVL